ncbi:uncharacterized protein LOC122497852 isoform X1 [Leptopilina heterotoma]|uniref:uncharacterized protein LOC122497852 isoform X1 n=1 Tax=Leptopilina heterotoma TaxID=63436 RepID=UPI001CA89CC1|nr:uncharacterized protein LOC122497852 isoform X1 [Leptopilina heterotoma]
MSDKYQIKVSTSFPTVTDAKIIYDVISVDKGPRRSGTTRILSVNDNSVEATFTGQKASKLRTALTSYFDSLLLVLDTIIQFKPNDY